ARRHLRAAGEARLGGRATGGAARDGEHATMKGRSSRTKGKAEPEAPDLTALAKERAELRPLTGSDSGMFNLKLLNQVWNALWRLENGAEWATRMGQPAAKGALRGIAPRDPLEGMLAAQ